MTNKSIGNRIFEENKFYSITVSWVFILWETKDHLQALSTCKLYLSHKCIWFLRHLSIYTCHIDECMCCWDTCLCCTKKQKKIFRNVCSFHAHMKSLHQKTEYANISFFFFCYGTVSTFPRQYPGFYSQTFPSAFFFS